MGRLPSFQYCEISCALQLARNKVKTKWKMKGSRASDPQKGYIQEILFPHSFKNGIH